MPNRDRPEFRALPYVAAVVFAAPVFVTLAVLVLRMLPTTPPVSLVGSVSAVGAETQAWLTPDLPKCRLVLTPDSDSGLPHLDCPVLPTNFADLHGPTHTHSVRDGSVDR